MIKHIPMILMKDANLRANLLLIKPAELTFSKGAHPPLY